MRIALLATLLATVNCGGREAASGAAPSRRTEAPPADLLIVAPERQIWLAPNRDKGNEAIGATRDPRDPAVQALAIRGGKVIATGACAELRARYFNPGDTRVVTLAAGEVAVPGLVDAHAHLYGLGKALETVDLRGAPSALVAAEKVARAAKDLPASAWVQGRAWDQNLWTPSEFPTAALLDAIVQPVALRRVDGHALWANGEAMKRAGITGETADPSGGRIVRDAGGQPTGVFIDTAIDLVEKVIPPDDAAARERRIRLAARHVAALGLTGVHSMGMDLETAAVYRKLAREGALDIRVYGFHAYRAGLEKELPPATHAPGMFELRGVKLFADGALGSRGASLLAPYSDAPDTSGLTITSGAEIERAGRPLIDKGYQLAVHAIGDRAIRETLDAYEKLLTRSKGDLRLRVEHAQIISPEDLPRFAQLKVIASMQPTHATSDMGWAEERVGHQRITGAYAWRKVLRTGAMVVFGSDFPVEQPNPLHGIYAAVTRRDKRGKPPGGWRPEEKVTLHEALAMFTVGPARASFGEGYHLGLTAGMAADISIFDGPLRADSSLLTRRSVATIVNGRVVYHDARHPPASSPTLTCAP